MLVQLNNHSLQGGFTASLESFPSTHTICFKILAKSYIGLAKSPFKYFCNTLWENSYHLFSQPKTKFIFKSPGLTRRIKYHAQMHNETETAYFNHLHCCPNIHTCKYTEYVCVSKYFIYIFIHKT